MTPLDAVLQLKALLGVVLVFGFLPGAVLHLLVLVYPRGHPRREELLAELAVIRRVEKPFWVAEQIAAVLGGGLPARLAAQRSRRAAARLEELRSDQRRFETSLLAYWTARMTWGAPARRSRNAMRSVQKNLQRWMTRSAAVRAKDGAAVVQPLDELRSLLDALNRLRVASLQHTPGA